MNVTDFIRKKEQCKKISVLTCYDYPSARTIAQSKIDCVLVGDTLAMVVHGYDSTIMATMEMMLLHTSAVARGLNEEGAGAKKQLLIADLPFLSHRISRGDTVADVKCLMQAGAEVIKIEGGDKDTCESIAYLTTAGIPVIGHIGLTPQSVYQFGGFKVQGKNEQDAANLIEQAQRLEQAGCCALVIECVPEELARRITASLVIPSIGIGAGVGTDGQVLVWHDLLGLQDDFEAKFIKRYMYSKKLMREAIDTYVHEVLHAQFPNAEYSY